MSPFKSADAERALFGCLMKILKLKEYYLVVAVPGPRSSLAQEHPTMNKANRNLSEGTGEK